MEKVIKQRTPWTKLLVEEWRDGIKVTYREYPKFFTVWANKGKAGKRLLSRGLGPNHDPAICFQRAFETLERNNPFDLTEVLKVVSAPSTEISDLLDKLAAEKPEVVYIRARR